MSTFADRAAGVPRRGHMPVARASKPYFLIGQDARGSWIIRESTGKKAGMFSSREAALRFARLQSTDEHFAVVHVNGGLEFDYASRRP
jgi:hypothetical protein